jgi:hypothetical protein
MMKVLQSRHLQSADYDAQSKTLVIRFVNGAMHSYHGVEQTTADSLLQSSSPGSYFHEKIRGKHTERKLMEGQTKKGNRSRRRF